LFGLCWSNIIRTLQKRLPSRINVGIGLQGKQTILYIAKQFYSHCVTQSQPYGLGTVEAASEVRVSKCNARGSRSGPVVLRLVLYLFPSSKLIVICKQKPFSNTIGSMKNKVLRLLALIVLAGFFRLLALPTYVRVKSDRIDRIETIMENYSTWFKYCEHILLDLGANRGDTILRWFTEERFTGRAKSSTLDVLYNLKQRQKFCVLSFEPNLGFASVLKKIEKDMNARGFKSKAVVGAAVSDKFSESTIYLDETSTHSFGTSLLVDKKVNFGGQLHSLGRNQSVSLLDFTAILKSIPEGAEIVVKMDIEGGEYEVLRSAISSGRACRIDVLIIEFHSHKLRKGSIPDGANAVLEWILKGKNCGVRVLHDD